MPLSMDPDNATGIARNVREIDHGNSRLRGITAQGMEN